MPEKPRSLKFDLVSDIHVDHWDGELDWENLRRNDIVVVAGDVADTIERTKQELERLSKAYKTVLYIDGNHEFCEEIYKGSGNTDDFDDRVRLAIAHLPNVHFLKDGVFISNGTAIIGRNGHWDYRLLDGVDVTEAQADVAEKLDFPAGSEKIFIKHAKQDAADLKQLVKELNENPDVHSILVVTHTLPSAKLLPDLPVVPPHFSNLGSSELAGVLEEDIHHKVRLWVFGHWHGVKDETIDGVHYVSNPRGTRRGKPPYEPRPLEVAPPDDKSPAPQPRPGPHPRPPSP
jgi:predicted phosphohydrolase